jgi:hypothetical protein
VDAEHGNGSGTVNPQTAARLRAYLDAARHASERSHY